MNTAERIEALSSKKNLCVSARNVIAAEIREKDGTQLHSEYQDAVNEIRGGQSANKLARNVDKLERELEKRNNYYKLATSAYGFAGGYLDGLMTVSLAAAPASGGSSMVLAGTAWALQTVVDEGLEYWQEESNKKTRSLLANRLHAIREEERQDLDQLYSRSPDVARKMLVSSTKEFFNQIDPADNRYTPDQVAMMTLGLGQMLEDHVKAGMRLSVLADENQDIAIGKLEDDVRQLNAMNEALLGWQVEAESKIGRIEENIHGINKGLKQLAGDVGSVKRQTEAQGRQIDFLTQVAFGNMTPAEQLAAIESGHAPPISKDKVEEIKLQKRRGELLDDMADYLNGAQLLVKVGGQFGVDEEILKGLSEATRIGGQVTNIATAYFSGNYLAAANGAADLIFGSSGADMAAQRHKAIVARLDALLAGQEEIKQNQERIIQNQQRLFENQMKIIENQALILEEIFSVGETIIKVYDGIMEELRRLRGDVLFNREILSSIIEQDTESIRDFIEKRRSYTGFAGDRFRSYEAMKGHFNQYGDRFRKLDDLEVALSERDSVHPLFLLRTGQTGDNADSIDNYIENVHTPLIRLWTHFSETVGADPKRMMSGLLLPSKSQEGILEKVSLIARGLVNQDQVYDRDHAFIDLAMGEPLAQRKINKIVGWISSIHFYYELLDHPDSETLLEIDRLLDPLPQDIDSKFKLRGYCALKDCLPWLEANIAQIALGSGDMILPYVSAIVVRQHLLDQGLPRLDPVVIQEVEAPGIQKIIKEVILSDDGLYEAVIRLLSGSIYFQQNWIAHFARQIVTDSGSTIATYGASYDACLANNDPKHLNDLLLAVWGYWGINWNLRVDIDKKGVVLQLPPSNGDDTLDIVLPHAATLMNEAMSYPVDMSDALQLKQRVVEIFSEYEFEDGVFPSHIEDFVRKATVYSL